jgi:hypothetical protein
VASLATSIAGRIATTSTSTLVALARLQLSTTQSAFPSAPRYSILKFFGRHSPNQQVPSSPELKLYPQGTGRSLDFWKVGRPDHGIDGGDALTRVNATFSYVLYSKLGRVDLSGRPTAKSYHSFWIKLQIPWMTRVFIGRT